MAEDLKYKTTAEIKVPDKLIDQVIGQERAVELIKKAAKQRRNVLLVGEPGTGKSMLAKGMADIMPVDKLDDVLIYPNKLDSHTPVVKVVPAGEGKKIVEKMNLDEKAQKDSLKFISLILPLGWFILSVVAWQFKWISDVIFAATLIVGAFLVIASALSGQLKMNTKVLTPKLLLDNCKKNKAPFVDGTGSKAGALFGDVKHDPLQCIPYGEKVHLESGKLIEINKLIDPIMPGAGEVTLLPEQRFNILGGQDQRFCYSPTIVHKVYKKNYSGDLIEISTRRGNKINVTPNHPIAVISQLGNIDYIDAGHLTGSEFLVLPYRLPNYKSADLDSNFVQFLGYFLADGYLSERTIGFKVKREFKIEQITACLERNGFNYKQRNYRGATIININSVALVRKLLSLGVKTNNGKSIPACVFSLSREKQIIFLSSYFSLDGYVSKQGQFEIFSKEMIPDLMALLLKVNVRAKFKTRLDPGFGNAKKTIQQFLIFNDYNFAKEYNKITVNLVHKDNLKNYLKSTNYSNVCYDDVIPVSFDCLEEIRGKTGLSKNKVNKAYYALKSGLKTSQGLTRAFLQTLCNRFLEYTNCPDLYKLKNISEGSYAYDSITKIEKKSYSGFVYNFTTETGNYLVNNVLTHNSGGLGTPPHLRVIPGMIHRAHKGVLFLDEIATLSPKSQQDLLTAMQEKKASITGQSELSSGAMVRTEPVPCDFVLVAAGNYDSLQNLHPAIRSRIRGYGYEVYMNVDMDDTPENRTKIVRFVAQEIKNDGKIPSFSNEAVEFIIFEARRRANLKKKLSLKFRELGGLIRAAGDIAKEKDKKVVELGDVLDAKKSAQTLEEQMIGKYITRVKDYSVFSTTGRDVGRVNGLAVLADGETGTIISIEADVAPSQSKSEGKIYATGKLGDIAKEAVLNVSSIIKKVSNTDLSSHDIHIQFLQTYSGVEGDSASIAVTTAVISAIEKIPVRQGIAMTGSLSVKGKVMPIGGVTAKVKAAIDAGFRTVIVPKQNLDDIILNEDDRKKIRIIPVGNLHDVLSQVFEDGKQMDTFLKKLKKELE